MPRDWRPLSLFGLCVVVSAGAVLLRFTERETGPDLPVEKAGVRLALLAAPVSPGTTGARGIRGDYLLEQGGLRVTLGGRRDSAESRQRWGAVMDVLVGNPKIDELELLRTVVGVEGQLVPLEVKSVAPDVSGDRPALLVVHESRGLRVKTRLDLALEPAALRLESELENTGSVPLDRVQLGDAVEWPGAASFAPRKGFVLEPDYVDVPWIAREGTHQSYALTFEGGLVGVRFLFDRIGPSGNIALGESTTLEPGAKLVYRRALLVSDRGLGAVSAAAYRHLGKTMGRVRGRVEPPPRSGTLQALQPDGRPVTELELPKSGRFELSLPVGVYRLALRTPGGMDEATLEVTTDRVEDVELLAPAPGSLRYVINDAAGRPMPGRLALRGVPPTKNPDFGAKQRARGVRNVAYSATGQGTLELPPGNYRVIVTRGFEYSIFEQEIRVDANSGASVRATLKDQLDADGWVSGDFHLHAAPSFDSSVPTKDRVISLAAEGVGFAVATDHNHVTDYAHVLREAELGSVLASSVGVEVTTKKWGHFIAFPYAPSEPPPPFEGVDPGLIFSVIRERAPGAVIQVNHPRMAGIAYFAGLNVTEELAAREPPRPPLKTPGAKLSAALPERPPEPADSSAAELLRPPLGFSFDFDSIEVVNGFELGKPELIWQNVLDWFALLNLGYRYTAVGNSDSHSLVHQWAGYPRTYVKVATRNIAELTPQEVAGAILYGRAQISNGIFLEVTGDNWAGPGDELSLEASSLPLRVLGRAAPWVSLTRAEVWVNGVRRAETRATASPTVHNRIQWATELELTEDSWVVVIARGDLELGEQLPGAKGKPFAITNPIFVDVDGDGVFRAPLTARETEGGSAESAPPAVDVSKAHQHGHAGEHTSAEPEGEDYGKLDGTLDSPTPPISTPSVQPGAETPDERLNGVP